MEGQKDGKYQREKKRNKGSRSSFCDRHGTKIILKE